MTAAQRLANDWLAARVNAVNGFTTANRDIIRAAAAHRLPAMYPFPVFARAGGLMSYGMDTPDIYRRAAGYVDRVLKG